MGRARYLGFYFESKRSYQRGHKLLNFPKDLYSDLRIEDSFETVIQYESGVLQEQRVRVVCGAFLRVFDGQRWYSASTTDVSQEGLQRSLDELAALATPNQDILSHPTVTRLHPHRDRIRKYTGDKDIRVVREVQKKELLSSYFSIFNEFSRLVRTVSLYRDSQEIKRFYSSKGADIEFDVQSAGVIFVGYFSHDGQNFFDSTFQTKNTFDELLSERVDLHTFLNKCDEFCRSSQPVEPGDYPVLLSPQAAGIFAHESFGHKSEADFMLGDPAAREEWAIGRVVGSPILSIIDSGCDGGHGELPYDDEGNKTERTFLVRNGRLEKRLHSAETAGEFAEEATGNARAVNFEYEPIPRMRSTFIARGKDSLDDVLKRMPEGSFFIDSVRHGFGMSTFTIAPARAYRIRNGAFAEPVRIPVLSGNVMGTLGEIEAVSSDFEMIWTMRGGCGKMDQFPLPVGIGGPYVYVRSIKVG